MVQHRCHATCVMVLVGEIAGFSMLNHLNLLDIFLGIGTPNSRTVLYLRVASRGLGCLKPWQLTLRFCCRKLTMLFAFFTVWPMCVFQEKVDWSLLPRYLVQSSVVCQGVALELVRWKAIPHFCSHDASLFRSSCRMGQICWVLIRL